MGSKIATLKSLSTLQLAYSRELSETRLDFYVCQLCDISPEVLFVAVQILIKTSVFLPTISEIRKTAREVMEQVTKQRTPDWAEAWNEVEQQIRKVGHVGRPCFSTPEIAETVRCIGWRHICETQVSNLNTLRAQLRDVYESVLSRKERQENISLVIAQVQGNPALKNNIMQALKSLEEKI